jgi:antitoxin component YwqK of YwqJK toxin-antitoxin module
MNPDFSYFCSVLDTHTAYSGIVSFYFNSVILKTLKIVLMNNVKLFLLLFCFPAFLFAQEAPNKTDAAGKKQGHWIKLDINKKKVYEGSFVNDVPTGKFIYYYPTGEQKAVSVFSKNGTISRTKMYSVGGKIMGEGKYVNEKKDSLWKFYDEDGGLLSEENYVNGLKDGKSKVFYLTGQLAEERTWKMGLLDGPRVNYFESGQIKYKGQYVKGKVEGKVTFYHPTGKVDAEGIYVNDLKDGAWKYYKEDGTLKRTDVYKRGVLTSPDPNIITKEQLEKEKEKYKDFELKNPEGNDPN